MAPRASCTSNCLVACRVCPYSGKVRTDASYVQSETSPPNHTETRSAFKARQLISACLSNGSIYFYDNLPLTAPQSGETWAILHHVLFSTRTAKRGLRVGFGNEQGTEGFGNHPLTGCDLERSFSLSCSKSNTLEQGHPFSFYSETSSVDYPLSSQPRSSLLYRPSCSFSYFDNDLRRRVHLLHKSNPSPGPDCRPC